MSFLLRKPRPSAAKTIGGKKLEAEIKVAGQSARLLRSKRKSLGLEVKWGEVTVRAPYYATLAEIQQFINSREAWLRAVLQKQAALPKPQQRLVEQGEPWFYLGHELSLVLREGAKKQLRINLEQKQLYLYHRPGKHAPSELKEQLATWYREQASDYLAERVKHYSALMNLRAKAVSVRLYKSRWGSCRSDGSLQFNWLLMMAPPSVIDYVVVHELSHLVHFNHSQAFWRLVASAMPDYQQHRQWLKQQTHLYWHDK